MVSAPQQKKKTSLAGRIFRTCGKLIGGLIIPLTLSWKKEADGFDKKGKPKTRTTFEIGLSRLKSAVFVGVYFVLQPLSSFLFPKAEDVLKKEGLDPKIVQTLTPVKDLRVIPNTALGKAYYLLRDPLILSPVKAYKMAKDLLYANDVQGFQDNSKPSLLTRLISPDLQTIMLKPQLNLMQREQDYLKKLIHEKSRGVYSYAPAVTPREYGIHVLLHEIRHSNPENRALPDLFIEADADHKAMEAYAAATGQPDLADRLLNNKLARKSAATHDSGLYIHLKKNGLPIPSVKEIETANTDAIPLINLSHGLWASKIVGNTKELDSVTRVFNKRMARLSPLAQLRVKLTVDADNSELRKNPVSKQSKPRAKPATDRKWNASHAQAQK